VTERSTPDENGLYGHHDLLRRAGASARRRQQRSLNEPRNGFPISPVMRIADLDLPRAIDLELARAPKASLTKRTNSLGFEVIIRGVTVCRLTGRKRFIGIAFVRL
jgi:hypothetical protein